MAYNFHKYGTDKVDSRGVGYDYKSVMHYGSTAFGGGRRTIIGVGGQTNLGQRYGLSEKDARQGNLLYCGGSPPVRTPAPPRPPTPPPPGECRHGCLCRAFISDSKRLVCLSFHLALHVQVRPRSELCSKRLNRSVLVPCIEASEGSLRPWMDGVLAGDDLLDCSLVSFL